jgi:hypothetical protein
VKSKFWLKVERFLRNQDFHQTSAPFELAENCNVICNFYWPLLVKGIGSPCHVISSTHVFADSCFHWLVFSLTRYFID